MKKKENKNIIDFNMLIIGLLLAGVTFWKTNDILFSIHFALFTFGTYYIIWSLIYFYIRLKLNKYQIKKTISEIKKNNFVYFIVVILVLLLILPKLLLFIFIGLITFIPLILLIIDIIRRIFK